MEMRNGVLIAFAAVLLLIALFSSPQESSTLGGMANTAPQAQFRCADPDGRNAYMSTSVRTYDRITGEERGSLPDKCVDSNNLNEAVCQPSGAAKYVPKYCAMGCNFQRNVCKS